MIPVDILMATYNGEKFVAQQIDSIIAQNYTHWRLLIRDDGSTDQTPKIIADYAKRYPDKIVLIKDSKNNLSVSRNFEALMKYATAPYLMFCDQDDIWLPDKIGKSLSKILEIEKIVGESSPVLIYTDLSVCDEHDNIIANSFWEYQKVDPTIPMQYASALVQNIATGNTMIFNRAAKEMALPFPKEIVMHDWWVALVALYLGKIELISDQTILYRQHAKNVSGQKGHDLAFMLKKIPNYCSVLTKNITQAQIFLSRYEHDLSATAKEILKGFSEILEKNYLQRLYIMIKNHYLSLTNLKDIAKFLMLIFCPKQTSSA